MKMFLEKFFPTSITTSIKKEICGIRHHNGSTSCVQLVFIIKSEQFLIQYFYEGLMLIGRSMIDATSSRALMDKTLATTRNLISNMIEHSTNTCLTLQNKLNQIVLKITKDTNYHLYLDNNNLCNLYNKIFCRIWSSRWQKVTFNSNIICLPQFRICKYKLDNWPPLQIPSQTILNPQQNSTKTISLPFPSKVVQAINFEINGELLQTFSKAEINIPSLMSLNRFQNMQSSLKGYAQIRGRS
ncbi:hypothetical protein CR513_47105, partial [Mucuna pruriens]